MPDSSADRRPLYPEIEPYNTGTLKVSDLHTIYFEECGNPKGKPVVIVHGGPGGGSNPTMRRTHNPEAYRIILFDQRGCGKSTPHAELRENTTWDLVADMERIRGHLGIDKWQLCGGSWGSTLSLAYAETHPDRVSEIILRGIFTLRKRELDWFYQQGTDALFPDAWEDYIAPIPAAERGNLMEAYYKRLTGENEAEKIACAKAWSIWEGTTLSLYSDPERVKRFADGHFALAFARIECHFFMNKGFFEPQDQLILNAGKLKGIPGVIAQGRYDVVTPMFTAWELSKAWPDAELNIVPDAGHTATEPGIVDVMVRASDRFAKA
ncbi:prolyl aminopeptidase [Parvibaculum sp.]|jgi:proline iminopeptidase|uniref:prolyl aminopeptidase n=1 Tax=Parvibaculum sp. TaxID=2024848 RepID=UPI001B2BE43C|nr:prolyl aminopeptidase [Parvibaculum sp.]MBO6633335.1 prolyl aminopeptidase [Parvibaculum sp.]MBO6678173.1 prolyl aminopeptidase [Parvibaculum sp.]MBO6683680.1 prolyl aminopeptidase [Parvibaculum sp.]